MLRSRKSLYDTCALFSVQVIYPRHVFEFLAFLPYIRSRFAQLKVDRVPWVHKRIPTFIEIFGEVLNFAYFRCNDSFLRHQHLRDFSTNMPPLNYPGLYRWRAQQKLPTTTLSQVSPRRSWSRRDAQKVRHHRSMLSRALCSVRGFLESAFGVSCALRATTTSAIELSGQTNWRLVSRCRRPTRASGLILQYANASSRFQTLL